MRAKQSFGANERYTTQISWIKGKLRKLLDLYLWAWMMMMMAGLTRKENEYHDQLYTEGHMHYTSATFCLKD